ncbi:actin-histidine N-methyltransferase isoform X1 [Salmo trutta]|uniref:actin-histidine N-methyltransferase isoform X1 n=1 Tax=Salmo trutta TaxID=8032 RepID=UPI0011313491|nr:actin-histidine N-methyltransferase-like isoform X1 [Salmo trutta]
MGKKSRVKTQKSGTGAMAVVSPKEMMNLISELLQKCSSAAPSPGKEWEEYVQIRGLVEKIRKKQKGISVIFEGSREEFFPELMAWAQESGASCEGFEISNFAGEGFGLRATKDIKAEELFLWIPRKMLMTVESAKNSVLGPLYSQDRILQAMGNVTLALHLLCERADPSSPWLPYIKTLPGDYDTPLYYEEEEVRHLLSTQAIQDVLSQYKNTARQYAYFYKVIQVNGRRTHPTTSKLPLKDAFTYDDYRWAVSSVMTRQNQIPTEDGSRVTLALIPLWDMCNHTNGLITTGYNLEDDRCECVALQDYKENDQIYIFYGTRSNAEFVIHNGFFFQENAHDRVKIKLGVSKSERLYAMKAEVLARAGIPSSSIFALHCSDPPISAQLLAFLRVFCMTEEELKDYLVGEHAINKIFTLGNTEFPVSWDNEIKLWTFLGTRAALLLQTYKTSSQDDQCALEKPGLSLHSRVAIQLRLAEKQILERVVASGKAKRLHFQQQQEEGAPLPRYEESDIALLENAEADDKLPIILRKLEEEGDDQAAVEQVLAQVQQLGHGGAARDLAPLIVNGDGGKVVVNGNGTDASLTEDASPVLEVASPIQEASKEASSISSDAGRSVSQAQDTSLIQEGDSVDANSTTPDTAVPATTQEQEGQTKNGDKATAASLSLGVELDLSAERTGDEPKVNSE